MKYVVFEGDERKLGALNSLTKFRVFEFNLIFYFFHLNGMLGQHELQRCHHHQCQWYNDLYFNHPQRVSIRLLTLFETNTVMDFDWLSEFLVFIKVILNILPQLLPIFVVYLS